MKYPFLSLLGAERGGRIHAGGAYAACGPKHRSRKGVGGDGVTYAA